MYIKKVIAFSWTNTENYQTHMGAHITCWRISYILYLAYWKTFLVPILAAGTCGYKE